jgi:hypothetical protein
MKANDFWFFYIIDATTTAITLQNRFLILIIYDLDSLALYSA